MFPNLEGFEAYFYAYVWHGAASCAPAVVVVEGGWNGCLLVLVSSLMWDSMVLAGWPKVQPFKIKRRHYHYLSKV